MDKKKIAFFSTRSWGQLGTAGTYNFVKFLSRYYEVRVFAPVSQEQYNVYSSAEAPLIPFRIHPFLRKKQSSIVHKALAAFDPDLVYIFNQPLWPALTRTIKEMLPNAKFLLDVKTPLLEGEKTIIQQKGVASQNYLDKIVTLSRDSVATWIPECTVETISYPLGLDTSLFNAVKKDTDQINRFVFCGILDSKRNIQEMIHGFALYVKKFNPNATLDIYGIGQDFNNLEKIISEHQYTPFIELKGKLEQKILFEKMSAYDAGIGWVPKAIYNSSPSLKMLEYLAASIPVVATATEAHNELLHEGFKFFTCDDTAQSLCDTLGTLDRKKISRSDIESNANLVKKYDYQNIIIKYIHPTIQDVLKCKSDELTNLDIAYPELNPDKKKLRMVFYIYELAAGRGGAERIALNTANEMCRRGHTVYVMYVCEKDKILPSYSGYNSLILLPYSTRGEAQQIVSDIDPSLLMVYYDNRKIVCNMLPFLKSTAIPVCLQECTNPTRLVTRNWEYKEKSLPLHRARWEREVLSAHATRIRLVMPSYIKSFQPAVQAQVRAFSNPCEIPPYSPRTGGADEKKLVFIVNAQKQNKNFPCLLMAFARVANDFPDWDIVSVGKFPSPRENAYVNKIYSLIEKLGLKGRVHLVEPTDDIFAWYAKAHLHVIASLSEGCPTVVLEAMSMGCPSIGFADCPGTNELIRHEKNGLLVEDAARERGLAEALKKLMADTALREQLGRQAFEDAKAFDPKSVYDQWERLFYEAAAYKNDPDRLLQEQMKIDPEFALHARRMFSHLSEYTGEPGE